MVIITGKEAFDYALPPRTIFDPRHIDDDDLSEDDGWANTTTASSHADTLTTRDTMSTFTGSPSHRRAQNKHPSQMNEVELRVQLWDSYRLARIILGTPIRSTSLRGKTILQSIRKVAEMKLELIRLQNELEMTKIYQDSQRSVASTVRMGANKKLSQSSSLGSSSLCEELNIQIANIVVPQSDNGTLSTLGTPSDVDEYNDSVPTPRRHTKTLSLEKRFDLYKARYDTLQGTHKEFMMELQEQLLAMQAQLEAVESKAGATTKEQDQGLVQQFPTSGIVSSRSERNTATTLDSPDNAAGPTKPRKGKSVSRAADAMETIVAVASDDDLDEQTTEDLELSADSAMSNHHVSVRKVHKFESIDTEREKLQQSIKQLMKRVEESSEETKNQYEALQEQLRAGEEFFSPSAPSVDMQTQQQFQKRLRTAKTLHTLELETFKSKHAQQLVDLFGQLEAYQHQVQRQNVELQKWRRKYNHLQEMAVTPGETLELLREFQALSPDSSKEEQQSLHAKTIKALQRMVQMQERQQKQMRLMQKTRALAQKRGADTQEQLEDLQLQHELLLDDTKIPPEVWQRQLSQQRKAFQKEIKDIFKREERRMVDIERMEVELTELAFMAVEIEDLEHEYIEKEVTYAEEFAKAQIHLTSTIPSVEKLKSQVKEALTMQQTALQDLERTCPNSMEALKAKLSKRPKTPQDRYLEHQEEELLQVKAELLKSQQRVRDLEAEIARG